MKNIFSVVFYPSPGYIFYKRFILSFFILPTIRAVYMIEYLNLNASSIIFV